MRPETASVFASMVLLLGVTAACSPEKDGALAAYPLEVMPSALPFRPSSTPVPTRQAEVRNPRPSPPALSFDFPTPGPEPVSDWRPPPYPAPWAVRPDDHFYFIRPIPSGEVNWSHPRYRYGNTHFGEEAIHTGVDLGASRGTPVLAAGPGDVVWAGYGLYRGIRDDSDPYGLAVAIRHDFGFEGEPLFTIYAHLESIDVWVGQRVEAGLPVGVVGTTGHASGPHLHFEIRVGENRYFATRNPELWMTPPEGWGVLAGRVMNTYGWPLEEHLVQIRNVVTDQEWSLWTYVNDTVHPDPAYGENFAISDLPSGPYEIRINYVGRTLSANLFVYAGQTNLVTFRGRLGFSFDSYPSPAELSIQQP